MNSFTSTQNPRSTSGNEVLNALQEKNVSRTLGHPELVRMIAASAPSTTTVEATAISVPRRALRCAACARSARRSTATALTRDSAHCSYESCGAFV